MPASDVKSKTIQKSKSKGPFKGTPRILLSGAFKGRSRATGKCIRGRDANRGRYTGHTAHKTSRPVRGPLDAHLNNTTQNLGSRQSFDKDDSNDLPSAGNSIAKELMMSIIGHIEFQENLNNGTNTDQGKTGENINIPRTDNVPIGSEMQSVQNLQQGNNSHFTENNRHCDMEEKEPHELESSGGDLDGTVQIKQEIIDEDW